MKAKRPEVIQVRLGVTELRDVDRAASKAGLQRSAWVRMVLKQAVTDHRLQSPKASLRAPEPVRLPRPPLYIPTKCAVCGSTDGHLPTCTANA